MKKVYIIYKHGMYGHGIYGVFPDKAEAIAACDSLAAGDVDDYHDWLVLHVPFGVELEGQHVVDTPHWEEMDVVVYSTSAPPQQRPK